MATAPGLKRGPGRPRKAALPPVPRVSSVAEQGSLMGDDEPQPNRPTEHKGVAVEREEQLQNLPRAPFRISRLYLVDGTTAYACRDCLFTGESRGEVMAHRNDEHGASYGKARPKNEIAPLRGTPDPILPPREDGSPAPTAPMEMTLGEFMALAPSITALGDLVDEAQRERDAAVEELNSMKAATRDWRIRAEQYDEMREELLSLRNWKRKMTSRLQQMGFQLTEEEQ